jgi:diguanylate cyclase (GGDEF)-like protein
MAAFGLIPDDPKQALRVRRFLMAAGTSALFALMLGAGASVGLVPRATALRAAGVILALLAVFYALFRSGANRRFPDPSLTFEQCAVAIITVAWVLYEADRVRALGALFYLVAMLFGVFRLGTGRMLVLAGLALAAHATVLWLVGVRSLEMGFALELGQFAALAIMLPWFAVMGGHVNRLRSRLSDSNRQLQAAVERIEEIAIRDELTGTYNRRFLIETLQRETARAARLSKPLGLCLFDLDHFKRINDTYGHAAGDAVLRRFTEIARTGLRGVDVLGRQGGEEFVLVLPDTDLEGVRACAERIRANVEREDFPRLPAPYRVTVSGGVACATRPETPDTLLARADRGLYAAKRGGRNRVVAVD